MRVRVRVRVPVRVPVRVREQAPVPVQARVHGADTGAGAGAGRDACELDLLLDDFWATSAACAGSSFPPHAVVNMATATEVASN